ncbi:hypothetical protein ERO13_A08G056801v2 [Gossypium hirsutum]|nr:hypothetical protein ERO13_A08G056801v2 [Gossypium hirsutum]
MTKEFFAEYFKKENSKKKQALYVMNPNKFRACSLASCPDESVVYEALNFTLSSGVLEFLVQNLAICLL